LLDRFARLTNRHPARVPLPGALAGLGTRLAGALGVEIPLSESQLTMLAEGNVIDPPRTNALQTVEGHPLAGAVRFTLGPPPTPVDTGVLRFQVEAFVRAANVVDWLAMSTVGNQIQDDAWRELVENVVRESGGRADDGVQSDDTTLEGAEAEQVEAWLRELALSGKQERNAPR